MVRLIVALAVLNGGTLPDGGPAEDDAGVGASADAGLPSDGGGTGTTGGGGGTTSTGGGTGGGANGGGGAGGGSGGGPGTGGSSGGGTGGSSGGGTGGSSGGTGGGGITTTNDGGIQREVFDSWADLSWAGISSAVAVAWVDDRRDLSFGTARRRGPDLWVNAWLPDAGLGAPFGQIACLGSMTETLSEPRVATSAQGVTVVAWRVAKASLPGHSIRVAILNAAGGLSTCNDELVPANGEMISGLQLEESNGDFLALWETPRTVMAKFVTVPAQDAFEVTVKANEGDVVNPTLTSTAIGFFAAWSHGEAFFGAAIPQKMLMPPTIRAQAYFPTFMRVTSATAMAPPLSGAFVAADNTGVPQVFSGLIETSFAQPLVGPAVGPRPILGAAMRGLTPRLYVGHQTFDRMGFAITEFGTSVQTLSLSAGFDPLAMIADDRRALVLMGNANSLRVQPIMPSVGTLGAPTFGSPITNVSSPSQLNPSAAWTDGGVFVIGWNEGRDVVGALLDTSGELRGYASNSAQDAGVITVHPVGSGPGFAVKVINAAGTAIYPSALGSGILTPSFFKASGSLSAAVVGEQAAALWSPGADSVTAGHEVGQPQAFTGARFGRCGAYAAGSIWIPAIKNGTELTVLEIVDSANETIPQPHSLGAFPRVGAPCLTARGEALLIVAHDSAGGLVVASTTVQDVRNGVAPELLPLPAQPAGRAVLDPVAAGNGRGWQLAWESPDDVGSSILGMKLELDGTAFDGTVLASGVDDRAPVLSPSSEGTVALLWQHFADRTGNAIVRAKILSAEPLQTDGGVSPDGGFPLPIESVTYNTCGCHTGDASALFALVLLVVSRARRGRRAEPRS
jgi:hypothetical protein